MTNKRSAARSPTPGWRTRARTRVLLFAAACSWFALATGCFQESIGTIPSDPEALRKELFEAVKYRGPDRCKALIEAGAPVAARDVLGWSPLLYAINRLRDRDDRDIRTIEALIEAEGADINAIANDGSTASWLATRHGAIDVLALLVERGADLDQLDDRGRTLLMEAAASRRSEMAGYLIERGADVGATARDGAAAITLAARYGAIEVLDLLLEHGANIERRDGRNMTLLMEAADYRRVEMVAHLIERGVEVDEQLPDGGTALFVAVSRGDPALVRLLIDVGADVNGNEKIASPIIFAPALRNEEIIELLLEAGADVNAVHRQTGITALHWAAKSSGASMVELLLEAGAQREIANRQGTTALDLARESGDGEVIRLLSPDS